MPLVDVGALLPGLAPLADDGVGAGVPPCDAATRFLASLSIVLDTFLATQLIAQALSYKCDARRLERVVFRAVHVAVGVGEQMAVLGWSCDGTVRFSPRPGPRLGHMAVKHLTDSKFTRHPDSAWGRGFPFSDGVQLPRADHPAGGTSSRLLPAGTLNSIERTFPALYLSDHLKNSRGFPEWVPHPARPADSARPALEFHRDLSLASPPHGHARRGKEQDKMMYMAQTHVKRNSGSAIGDRQGQGTVGRGREEGAGAAVSHAGTHTRAGCEFGYFECWMRSLAPGWWAGFRFLAWESCRVDAGTVVSPEHTTRTGKHCPTRPFPPPRRTTDASLASTLSTLSIASSSTSSSTSSLSYSSLSNSRPQRPRSLVAPKRVHWPEETVDVRGMGTAGTTARAWTTARARTAHDVGVNWADSGVSVSSSSLVPDTASLDGRHRGIRRVPAPASQPRRPLPGGELSETVLPFPFPFLRGRIAPVPARAAFPLPAHIHSPSILSASLPLLSSSTLSSSPLSHSHTHHSPSPTPTSSTTFSAGEAGLGLDWKDERDVPIAEMMRCVGGDGWGAQRAMGYRVSKTDKKGGYLTNIVDESCVACARRQGVGCVVELVG
ncbi:hypothetical protein M427DRAFT_38905 [Gonapodya prolifera JEL478]|uniref:Uncharacterized protein n=1 Tax=Gonapodya prolifera (strain JEL478) TaxID=1344416 RepID=A0A138ZZ76_GONPJ|nr:hypothetical protein M427DRAFT_38905 [Gonapodya prolifera JEL478]|eukprot:KXS09433.1 hypothetical protein M427DRAFT_38905 [Gonapodya prolifera JEL478]